MPGSAVLSRRRRVGRPEMLPAGCHPGLRSNGPFRGRELPAPRQPPAAARYRWSAQTATPLQRPLSRAFDMSRRCLMHLQVRSDTLRPLRIRRNQPCVEESFQRREGVPARLAASLECCDNLLQIDRPASDLTQVKAVVWEEAKGLRPGGAGRVEGGSPFLRARGDDAGPVRRLGVAAFIG